ncbi:phasin family protein [Paraburkholderia panacisoli]|uniref:Phasin family protein n=1 Tax=Paraburkholderia panacisoli TaxID=2603818 RepID=A0A5B0GM09_9BURK|nr:phasin family protein [Paraburkholderia panacisoli]KAA1004376.1 phasin family protein [Paraburkholderia panacisoli]
MFFYSQQQISDINKANYQSLVNLVGKCMNGYQKLAELNMQTVRTIIDESNNFPTDEISEKSDNLPEWQSSMLTQFPEKAASYNRHFRSIMLSTGAEVMRETRRQYESRGNQVDAIFEEAIEKATAATARAVERLAANVVQPAQDSFDATVKVEERSSSEAFAQGTKAGDDVVAAIEAPVETHTKSANKR